MGLIWVWPQPTCRHRWARFSTSSLMTCICIHVKLLLVKVSAKFLKSWNDTSLKQMYSLKQIAIQGLWSKTDSTASLEVLLTHLVAFLRTQLNRYQIKIPTSLMSTALVLILVLFTFRYYITRAKLVSKIAKYPHVVRNLFNIHSMQYWMNIVYLLLNIGWLFKYKNYEGCHHNVLLFICRRTIGVQ